MFESKRIRGYRNMLGKTQTEMAKVLNISPQAYMNKEKGYVDFRNEEMMNFKNQLLPLFPDITIEDIFF